MIYMKDITTERAALLDALWKSRSNQKRIADSLRSAPTLLTADVGAMLADLKSEAEIVERIAVNLSRLQTAEARVSR